MSEELENAVPDNKLVLVEPEVSEELPEPQAEAKEETEEGESK